jgi:hypothetical protein
MDSIRQSGFQATARVKQRGISHGSGEGDGTEEEERPKDGFSECLVPEQELDSEEEQREGERHEDELLEKYRLWDDEVARLLMGLITALEEEEVLFFAAHELAHTELRHYATRKRRLSDLRQLIPAPIGSPVRQRMDLAAVLAVRHQEEFEADRQAVEWVGSAVGERALRKLHNLCRESSPGSLQRPTHPKFELRVSRLVEGKPFDSPLEYLYSLIG